MLDQIGKYLKTKIKDLQSFLEIQDIQKIAFSVPHWSQKPCEGGKHSLSLSDSGQVITPHVKNLNFLISEMASLNACQVQYEASKTKP